MSVILLYFLAHKKKKNDPVHLQWLRSNLNRNETVTIAKCKVIGIFYWASLFSPLLSNEMYTILTSKILLPLLFFFQIDFFPPLVDLKG